MGPNKRPNKGLGERQLSPPAIRRFTRKCVNGHRSLLGTKLETKQEAECLREARKHVASPSRITSESGYGGVLLATFEGGGVVELATHVQRERQAGLVNCELRHEEGHGTLTAAHVSRISAHDSMTSAHGTALAAVHRNHQKMAIWWSAVGLTQQHMRKPKDRGTTDAAPGSSPSAKSRVLGTPTEMGRPYQSPRLYCQLLQRKAPPATECQKGKQQGIISICLMCGQQIDVPVLKL